MQPTIISGGALPGYPAGATVVRQVARPGMQVVQPGQQVVYAPAYQQAQATRIVGAPMAAAPQVVQQAAPQMVPQAVPQTIAPSVMRSAVAAPRLSVASTSTALPTTVSASVPSSYLSSSLPAGATVIRSAQAAAPLVSTSVRIQPGAAAGQPLQVVSTTQASAERPHTLAGPGYTQGAYEAKHQEDPQLQNLKELRKTSGLKLIPVSEGLSKLKDAADDGKLSRAVFLETYVALLQSHEAECPPESVQNAVFDLFDRDDNNIVDMMELICGISLLCSGTEDDKIQAVFNVFDENGDGFISMDEMFKFLTSVFKVVLTPNVLGVMNSMGVSVESAEDLASVTALECFRTADLNNDNKLSITEFKNWFYAPRNDPSFLFSPVRKLLL